MSLRAAIPSSSNAAATASGLAKENEEPLPDYTARFIELDAKLRAIDSTTSCTNYLAWMNRTKRLTPLRKNSTLFAKSELEGSASD